MILNRYLKTIERFWWLIILITLATFAISLAVSLSVTPRYRASATFIVAPNPNLTSSRDLMTSLDTLSNASIIPTYADILKSNRVFSEAARDLGLDTAILQAYTQEVNVKTGSGILELVVEGPDPEVTTELVNAMGNYGITYIQGIYQVFDINFLDQAVLPGRPFYPTPLRNGGIAAGIGLLIGLVLAGLSESIRVPLEALRERSVTDRITSAYTQSHFRRRIEQEMARSPSDPVSLALISFEGLRDLQNELPESVRIGIMHHLTEMLKNKLYGTDIVGAWEGIGYGILMPGTPDQAALRTMDRIRQSVYGPVELDGGEKIDLQARIGLASRSSPGEASGELIGKASTALERSRQSDTDEIVLYKGD